VIESEKNEAARTRAAIGNNQTDCASHDNQKANCSPINCDLEIECLHHMGSNEIPFVGPLHADGEVYRFSIDRNLSKKDEWYLAKIWEFKARLYLWCSYGSWSIDKKFTFRSWEDRNDNFSADEKEELDLCIKKMEKLAEEIRRKRQDEAAKEAQEIWDKASNSPLIESQHTAYLQMKKIGAHIARFGANLQGYASLIIPLWNIQGQLRSLQFISVSDQGKSFKSFLPGGEKKGCFSVLGDLTKAGSFFVSEGFATAATIYEAKDKPVIIAFDCGNLDSVINALREKYPNHRITIAADDDFENPHNPGRKKAEEAAEKHHCDVVFPKFPEGFTLPNGKSGTDFNDVHVHIGLEEVRKQLQWKTRLNPINITDMMSREIPPKKVILKPWLREKDLAMIYAARGLGKTWFALSIAHAIASGDKVLNFEATDPRRVLYVDGEMPASTIKDRLAKVILCSNVKIQNPNFLRIINHDLEENMIRDLGTRAGQQDINELIDEFEVLILDNLSCLIHSGDENEAASWVIVQGWLLQLRKLGKTVIFIHHAGKSGQQRGTSKKEDVLDTVIVLKKPKDWSASDGARFEVHYEKNRGFEGDEAKPFEARLVTNANGVAEWIYKGIEGTNKDEALKLYEEGLSMTDIAKEVGVDKSTVSRWIKAKKR